MNAKPMRILIVDDSSEIRQVLGKLLERNGFDVTAAPDGPEALELAKLDPPDLFLLDVTMPGMDGYEVCAALKATPALEYIPVIFLTAKATTEDIVRGFRAGGVDYIAKPFSSEELLARVRTHIEIRVLRGLLPICSCCKSVRDDEGYWHNIEEYIEQHSKAIFSHSLCRACADKLYGDQRWYQKKLAGEKAASKTGPDDVDGSGEQALDR